MNTSEKKISKFVLKKKNFSNNTTFKDFGKVYPEHSEVSVQAMVKIINLFNKEIHNTIIKERYGIQLPEGLGNIFLAACDRPQELKYYTNDGEKVVEKKESIESEELLLKIFYSNNGKNYKIANSQLWGFEACRLFKREASKNFKFNFKKYIRISKDLKLKSQLENDLKNEKILKYKEFTNKNNKGFDI
jgi:hypothetical protein